MTNNTAEGKFISAMVALREIVDDMKKDDKFEYEHICSEYEIEIEIKRKK